ncbi:MAG: hypothetical protein AAF843_11155 [Bacteroidota bacterium]
MKWKTTQTLLSSPLFGLAALVFISCGSKHNTDTAESETSEISNSSTESASVSKNLSYSINSIANEKIAEISISGEELIISLTSEKLFGILKKADKRKYFDQNDQLRYTVKYKQDGFKLNAQDESLRWKIKLFDDHLKISNNNEMAGSYRIGFSRSNKMKVKKDDLEVATLRVKEGDTFITIKDKYNLRNFGNSLALGILLIDSIPENEKIILCAELIKKSK